MFSFTFRLPCLAVVDFIILFQAAYPHIQRQPYWFTEFNQQPYTESNLIDFNVDVFLINAAQDSSSA
ncbi:hypothetical protein L6452_34760 [Arctium lappa]|uniref:Uncharacterized protein n=1 Tax=Arctium lappa TaxID=4217 RepID=A0ACB8YJT5_ARCLA|nr:hypothetical protein L6452_34760 [Arctium lappa]